MGSKNSYTVKRNLSSNKHSFELMLLIFFIDTLAFLALWKLWPDLEWTE